MRTWRFRYQTDQCARRCRKHIPVDIPGIFDSSRTFGRFVWRNIISDLDREALTGPRGQALPFKSSTVLPRGDVFSAAHAGIPPRAFRLVSIIREFELESTLAVVGGLVPCALPTSVFDVDGGELAVIKGVRPGPIVSNVACRWCLPLRPPIRRLNRRETANDCSFY